MARIFKIGGYLVDTRGYFDVCDMFEKIIPDDLIPQHIHIEQSKDFEWDGNLPINQANCDLAHCEAYFKPLVASDEGSVERGIPKFGEIWKHFKEGKEVDIIAVSKNSEFPDQLLVTYSCPNGVYTRPLDMFMSRVDKEKYPDAKQEWRFEKVEMGDLF